MFKRIFNKSNTNIILASMIALNLFTNVEVATSVNTTNVTTANTANKSNVTTSTTTTTNSNTNINNTIKNNEIDKTKVETNTNSTNVKTSETSNELAGTTTSSGTGSANANKATNTNGITSSTSNNPTTSLTTTTSTKTENKVKTLVRTRNNLLVSDKKIELTESIISDILKTPAVDAKLKIYDFAELISEKDEEKLYNTFLSYITKTNMDIVLVTSKQNDRRSTSSYYAWERYAEDFFDYNDFGIGESRDGIILFIDMTNRQLQISTSGKAQLYYPYGRCQSIIDEIKSYATKMEYASVGTLFVNKATSYYDMGIPKEYRIYDVDEYGNLDYKLGGLFVHYIPRALIIAAVVAGIFVAIGLFLSRKPKKSTNAKYYLKKDSFVLTNKIDNFVTTNTVRTKIQTSSGGSSGGGGGGRSHGGASGGF